MLQEYCRRLGIGTSEEEIRDLVATLEVLPQHHPLVPVLRGSRDARHADALRDALLNPRDRAYSVPELFDLIERNGLMFGRWYWQAPYVPHCGAVAVTPHREKLAALSSRDRATAMELWRGTMTAHSVIVHHAGARESNAFDASDDHWLQWVPVRLPWTQLLQERLPQGAAGVLLNRSHQFHDLILSIDERDRALFERIDGQHTIREIVEQAAEDDHGRARTFFEKLWWYDQVVFDTSTVNHIS
jgi:hypothetical protein